LDIEYDLVYQIKKFIIKIAKRIILTYQLRYVLEKLYYNQ